MCTILWEVMSSSLLVAIIINLINTDAYQINKFSTWSRDEDGDNLVYLGDVKFHTQTRNKLVCSLVCKDHGSSCLAFSFTTGTNACYGYGNVNNPVPEVGATLWRRRCPIDDYELVPILQACVWFSTVQMSWTSASDTCRSVGGSLLALDTREKMDAMSQGPLRSNFTAAWHWWLGGKDYNENGGGDWRWLNGKSISTDLWSLNEPSSDSEKCVEMYTSHIIYALNDLSCEVERRFVCEHDL